MHKGPLVSPSGPSLPGPSDKWKCAPDPAGSAIVTAIVQNHTASAYRAVIFSAADAARARAMHRGGDRRHPAGKGGLPWGFNSSLSGRSGDEWGRALSDCVHPRCVSCAARPRSICSGPFWFLGGAPPLDFRDCPVDEINLLAHAFLVPLVADELLQPIFQVCKNVGAHGSQ